MGGWFLEVAVRHLCLDKGYDYPRVSEEVYVNGFEEHIRSRGGRSSGMLEESCPPLGSGAFIRLVEGLSEPAHSLLLLPRQFYGVLYLALACIL